MRHAMESSTSDTISTGDDSMNQLIGVSAAARALGVNKSTVSRYLARFGELNHAAAGAPPLVDLEELRRHRAENLNPDVMGAVEDRMQEPGFLEAAGRPGPTTGAGANDRDQTTPLTLSLIHI